MCLTHIRYIRIDIPDMGIWESLLENPDMGIKENLLDNRNMGIWRVLENPDMGIRENLLENSDMGIGQNLPYKECANKWRRPIRLTWTGRRYTSLQPTGVSPYSSNGKVVSDTKQSLDYSLYVPSCLWQTGFL